MKLSPDFDARSVCRNLVEQWRKLMLALILRDVRNSQRAERDHQKKEYRCGERRTAQRQPERTGGALGALYHLALVGFERQTRREFNPPGNKGQDLRSGRTLQLPPELLCPFTSRTAQFHTRRNGP